MQKELIERNHVLKLSTEFSLLVIDYFELLHQNKKFVISQHLLRSGTYIGANGKTDCIHKIKIAANEADETQYWLAFCYHECNTLILKLEEVHNKVLNKILATTRRKSPFSYLLSFFIF